MITQQITLTAPSGLHARPASELVKLVKSLDGNVFFATATKRINASSMLSLLSLGLKSGSEFEICVDGGDEANNLSRVIEFIQNIAE